MLSIRCNSSFFSEFSPNTLNDLTFYQFIDLLYSRIHSLNTVSLIRTSCLIYCFCTMYTLQLLYFTHESYPTSFSNASMICAFLRQEFTLVLFISHILFIDIETFETMGNSLQMFIYCLFPSNGRFLFYSPHFWCIIKNFIPSI